ncbi:hypothetical protein GCM10023213_13950 [Prosthecobacter algae]|uniref:Uncharacterized protein n=1 Tax=Prosthecobacter algae TaxID=1144682 RepID=A0ABP9P048_9BACT
MPATEDLATNQTIPTTLAGFQALGLVDGAWARARIGMLASCLGDAIFEVTGSLSLNLANHPPGIILKVNSASAVTITIPADASFEFPNYHQIPILRYGAGQLTIVAGAGATVKFASSRDNANGQNAVTYLIKTAANEWFFTGDTSTS